MIFTNTPPRKMSRSGRMAILGLLGLLPLGLASGQQQSDAVERQVDQSDPGSASATAPAIKMATPEELATVAEHFSMFSAALDTMELDTGCFPTVGYGLGALLRAPPNVPDWGGPYLTHLPNDPWGNAYHYGLSVASILNPTRYAMRSMGPDGKHGTADDIRYRAPTPFPNGPISHPLYPEEMYVLTEISRTPTGFIAHLKNIFTGQQRMLHGRGKVADGDVAEVGADGIWYRRGESYGNDREPIFVKVGMNLQGKPLESVSWYREQVLGAAPPVAPNDRSQPATPPAPAANTPIHGTLVEVGDQKLVVDTIAARGRESKRESILLDQNTRIVIDGAVTSADKLLPGMRISAVHSPATRMRPAGLVITAISDALEGKVARIDGTILVLQVPSADGDSKEVRVTTDHNTNVIFHESVEPGRFDARIGAIEAIPIDARVRVLPKTGVALRVTVEPPLREAAGRVQPGPATAPSAGAEPVRQSRRMRLTGIDTRTNMVILENIDTGDVVVMPLSEAIGGMTIEERLRVRRTQEGPQRPVPSVPPGMRAEQLFVLTGIIRTAERATAYVEDVLAAEMIALAPGDSVAGGRIVEISFEGIRFQRAGADEPTFVAVGMTLEGERVSSIGGYRAQLQGQQPGRGAPAPRRFGLGTRGGPQAAPTTQVVLDALVQSLQDPDPGVRQATARGLGHMGASAQGTTPALMRLLRDSDAGVRAAVAEALGQIRSAEKSSSQSPE